MRIVRTGIPNPKELTAGLSPARLACLHAIDPRVCPRMPLERAMSAVVGWMVSPDAAPKVKLRGIEAEFVMRKTRRAEGSSWGMGGWECRACRSWLWWSLGSWVFVSSAARSVPHLMPQTARCDRRCKDERNRRS